MSELRVIVLGEGVFTYANGDTYKGEFKDYTMHGKLISELRVIVLGRGVLRYANGDMLEGNWIFDIF